MSSRVEIRDHPQLGRSLFACQSFNHGYVVVHEEPLLMSASTRDPTVKALHAAALKQYSSSSNITPQSAIPGGDWLKACAWLVAVVRASASTQQAVLQDMHCSPHPDSDMLVTSTTQAQVLSSVAPQVLQTSTAAAGAASGAASGAGSTAQLLSMSTVLKVLLVYHLNAHEIVYTDTSVVYHLGSKLAHTCSSANTTYRSNAGKGGFNGPLVGYHIAVKAIEAGDLLTTHYLGERHMLLPTRTRQQLLDASFGFHCCCERCSDPVDITSCMPCPSCAPAAQARRADGTLPPDIALGDKRPAGLLCFNYSLQTYASSMSSSTSCDSRGGEVLPWVCSSCGLQLPDTDAALFGSRLLQMFSQPSAVTDPGSSNRSETRRLEDRVVDAVVAADKELDANPMADIKKTMSLIAMVGKTLGAEHGAMLYALMLHTEVALGMLNGCGVAVQQFGRAAIPGMILSDFEYYLSEIEDNWQRVWAWLRSKERLGSTHLDGVVDALLLEQVRCASSVLKTATACAPLLHRSEGRAIKARSQDLASALLDKAEPRVEAYSNFSELVPLEKNAVYKTYLEGRDLLASLLALPSAAASGSSSQSFVSDGARLAAPRVSSRMHGAQAPAALSMQELQDFLPSAGGASSSRSTSSGSKAGKGKGKGKKGGKKKHHHRVCLC